MNFIKMPNLPQEKVKAVVMDYRTNHESIKRLNSIGIEVFSSAEIDTLYEAVNGHPDMQLHHLGGSRFVCAKEAYEHYLSLFPKDVQLICGTEELGRKYPADIAFNAAAVGEYLICNKKHTAKEIVASYSKIIDVKQGYAKCSVAIVSKNAIMTADVGIYKAMSRLGYDVLLIKPGQVKLDGMSCGFIGGACGLIAPDVLAVNGSLKSMNEKDKISDFCNKFGVKILELNNEELYDIGSVIPIY